MFEEQQNQDAEVPRRPQKLASVVKYLVGINILFYIATYFVFDTMEMIDLLALHHFRSEKFEWFQFVSHMFMHAGFFHIFLNMFILWMFGSSLEYVWNSKKFIVYYFITGLGAAALHIAVSTLTLNDLRDTVNAYQTDPGFEQFNNFVEEEVGEIPEAYAQQYRTFAEIQQLQQQWAGQPQNQVYEQRSVEVVQRYYRFVVDRPSLGASGAVFGILLAFGLLFPNVPVYLYFLFPIKAKYFVIFLGALELYFGVFVEDTGVANFAHLGGMLFGFILLKIWGEKARRLS